MLNYPNFSSHNLAPGQILGELRLNVSLNADNLVINPGRTPFILITSNDTTAANRTFTLTNGYEDGALLHLVLVSAAATTAQLASSANVSLIGAWEPIQNQTLTLQWDDQLTIWRELSRSASGAAALASYTPATGANWVDPDPTTVQEALDRIADAVEGLLTAPIP